MEKKLDSNKREFSSHRLYRFIRFLVIAVSLLSIWIAKTSYDNSIHWQSQESTDLQKCSDNYNKAKKDNENYFATYKQEVLYTAEMGLAACRKGLPEIDKNIIDNSVQGTFLFGAIAILLPLIFFGGVGIYHYIFPVKKE